MQPERIVKTDNILRNLIDKLNRRDILFALLSESDAQEIYKVAALAGNSDVQLALLECDNTLRQLQVDFQMVRFALLGKLPNTNSDAEVILGELVSDAQANGDYGYKDVSDE